VLALVRSSGPTPDPSYHPRTPALAPELGRMYAAQCRNPTAAGDDRLRAIVFALVRRLKDDGLAPERVIVALKTAITRYGDERRPPSLADEEDGHVHGGDVYVRLFHWTLDAYFSAEG
jgi:hypothetical protein